MAGHPHTRRAKDQSKILIVEDDKLLAYIILLTLEGEGFTVRTAANGREGFASYLPFKPDLVITDLDMPEIDGLQMMREIRKVDPGVRAILMTGESEDRFSCEQEKYEASVSILEKPFSRIELLREVSTKLGQFSSNKHFASLL